VGYAFARQFTLMAVLVVVFSPLQSLAAGDFYIGPSARASGFAAPLATSQYRIYCDPTLKVNGIWLMGSDSANAADYYLTVAGATTTIARGTAGRVFRGAYITPASCNSGYVDFYWSRASAAPLEVGQSTSYANGDLPTTSTTSVTHCIANCGAITANVPLSVIAAVSYSVNLATSSGSSGSSDMSTTTIALAYGPIHYALGLFLFLFAVLVWSLITKRNKY